MRAKDGDAYPLGALPIGTKVHCIEQTPGITFHRVRAAGTFGTIIVRMHTICTCSKETKLKMNEIALFENLAKI